jgi:uncharacterized protein (TIGR02265 family)
MSAAGGYPRRFRTRAAVPLEGEIDEAARIAQIPRHHTTKGMYLASLLDRLDEAERAAVIPRLRSHPRHGTYQPFLDYPRDDTVVLLHAVARKHHPGVSVLEGLRHLGRGTVKVFLQTQTGRVVKSMITTPRDALLKLPQIWKKTDPQSTVVVDERPDASVRFVVDGFPSWLDCGFIGTLEQVVMNHRCDPEIDVHLTGPTRGTFVVSWTVRGTTPPSAP